MPALRRAAAIAVRELVQGVSQTVEIDEELAHHRIVLADEFGGIARSRTNGSVQRQSSWPLNFIGRFIMTW